MLETKQENEQGQEAQQNPSPVPGRVLGGEPLGGEAQGLAFKANVEQGGNDKGQSNGQEVTQEDRSLGQGDLPKRKRL